MSLETLAHLNTQTLIGYTSKRGQAWHYRAEYQGSEPNHYEHAVPVADVRRRLFHWSPVEADIQAVVIDEDGVEAFTDATRKAIVRPDTGAILGIFRSGYKVHDYDQWLINNAEGILDADLHIGSAGLLRGGAVAWVQVEMADTLSAAGVEFRPFLTATTSLDGSIATTYQTGAQVVVCDNTLSAALNTADTRVKVRHSSNSLSKLAQVRDALGIVHQVAEDFTAQVQRLTKPTRHRGTVDAIPHRLLRHKRRQSRQTGAHDPTRAGRPAEPAVDRRPARHSLARHRLRRPCRRQYLRPPPRPRPRRNPRRAERRTTGHRQGVRPRQPHPASPRHRLNDRRDPRPAEAGVSPMHTQQVPQADRTRQGHPPPP
jgi:phage/plasmid-like protein (TIGR03299 family)